MQSHARMTIIGAVTVSMLLAGTFAHAATIALSSATATVNQGGFPISNTLVDDGSGWATLANASVGVYTTNAAVGLFDTDGALKFSLDHAGSCCGGHELGHFRLSATSDPSPTTGSTWTVLTPNSAVSSGAGESFTINPGVGPSGSVVLQNPNAGRPLYTIEAPISVGDFTAGLTGFRLEALKVPGNGLSGNGPGTSTNATPGNFVLTHFSVDLALDNSPFGPATNIAVANHSFEADGSTATFVNGTPTDWLLGAGGGGGWMGGLAAELIPRPDGTDTHAWSNGQDLFQVTSELITAETLYTLTVDLGDRTDTAFPTGTEIRLGAGGTFGVDLLDATFLSNPTPNAGWETWTVSAFIDATNPLVGQPLRIELISGGVQPQFDDVHLTAQAMVGIVPEPSALALASLSLMSLGLIGWRRRRR